MAVIVPRMALAVALVLVASAALPAASAQDDLLPKPKIRVTAAEFTLAVPEGDPATSTFSAFYECARFQKVTMSLTVVEGNASGTPGIAPTELTLKTLPDCTPGAEVSAGGNMTVSTTKDQIAGAVIDLNLTATGADALGTTTLGSIITGAAVGSLLDVTFTPTAAEFQTTAPGKLDVRIDVKSASNTEIIINSAVDGMPADWPRANVDPLQVKSPLEEGKTGESAIEFTIDVPEGATGETTLTFTATAKSLIHTDVVDTPFTTSLKVTVTGKAPGEGKKDKESAGPSPFAAMLLAAAALAVARRR